MVRDSAAAGHDIAACEIRCCLLQFGFENWNVVGASASQYIMSLGSMGLQRRCFPRTTRLRVLQMDNMKRGRRRGLARGALAGLRALRRCAMRFTAGERSSNAAAYAGEGDASSAAADRSTRDAGVLLERVSLCPEYCRSNRGLRS